MGEEEEKPSSEPPPDDRPPEPEEVLPPPLPLGEAFFPRMRIQSSSEEIRDDVPARFRDGGEGDEAPREEAVATHPDAQRAVRTAIISLFLPFLAPIALWQAFRAARAINADPRPVRGRVQAGCAGLVATAWLSFLLWRLLLLRG